LTIFTGSLPHSSSILSDSFLRFFGFDHCKTGDNIPAVVVLY